MTTGGASAVVRSVVYFDIEHVRKKGIAIKTTMWELRIFTFHSNISKTALKIDVQ